MIQLILLVAPVATGAAILMRGELSTSKIVSAFTAALILFAVMIAGIAAVHPPADRRHHAAQGQQTHPL